jgi:hypothetical protein
MFRNVVCRVGARIASASAADVAASLRRRSGALLPSTAATTQRAALFHTSATPRFANGAANGRPQQTERGYEEKIDPHDPDSSVPLLQVHDDIKLLAEEARLIDQTEPSGIEENLPAPEGEVEFDTTKTDVWSFFKKETCFFSPLKSIGDFYYYFCSLPSCPRRKRFRQSGSAPKWTKARRCHRHCCIWA